MKVKKVLAALLAAVLMFSCLPFAASAAKTPGELYVGEKKFSGDNLIAKYKSEGRVLVYAIDTDSQAYYTVTKEDNVGYVLTFYNDYVMSEMVTDASSYCGVYCDGDLTIRLAGNITFDANDAKKKNAIGWFVEGQLTIEDALVDESGKALPARTAHVLDVNGALAKTNSESGSIGIYAQTLILHNVTVNACGGYAGVVTEEAIVMLNSTLNANTAEDMKDGDECLFKYGLQTNHFIQSGGAIRAAGDVNVQSYYFDGGTHAFDQTVVVYARNYDFAEEKYTGNWLDSYKLFLNPDQIPSCMRVSVGSSVAKIDGNSLLLNRRGTTTLLLTIRCGRDTLVMCGPLKVSCTLLWWQWIPYILSFSWIDAILN